MWRQRIINQRGNAASSVKHRSSFRTAASNVHSAGVGCHLLGVVQGVLRMITSMQSGESTGQTLLFCVRVSPTPVIVVGCRTRHVIKGMPPASLGSCLRRQKLRRLRQRSLVSEPPALLNP